VRLVLNDSISHPQISARSVPEVYSPADALRYIIEHSSMWYIRRHPWSSSGVFVPLETNPDPGRTQHVELEWVQFLIIEMYISVQYHDTTWVVASIRMMNWWYEWRILTNECAKRDHTCLMLQNVSEVPVLPIRQIQEFLVQAAYQPCIQTATIDSENQPCQPWLLHASHPQWFSQ